MNKAFIGAGIALGLALAGCNNSAGVFPVGIPTVVLSLNGVKNDFVAGTPAAGTTPAVPPKYTVTGTLEVRTQKGSVAGTIAAFKENDTELFGGPFVEACPVTSAKECGPFSIPYAFTYTSDPGDVRITSIVVQALNGNKAEIQLAAPLVLRSTQ